MMRGARAGARSWIGAIPRLRAAIRELMESPALRERLGRNARRLATDRHDARVVSEEMRRHLAAAIAHSENRVAAESPNTGS